MKLEGRFLMRIARSSAIGGLIGVIFERFSFLLPVKKVYNSVRVVAFVHPRPICPEHVLIVPKVGLRSLLNPNKNQSFYRSYLEEVAQVFCERLKETEIPLRLVVNCGAYQEVAQVHFHVLPEKAPRNLPAEAFARVDNEAVESTYRCIKSDREIHYLIENPQIEPMGKWLEATQDRRTAFAGLLWRAVGLGQRLGLDRFCVCFNYRAFDRADCLTVHLLSGKQI